MPWTVLYAPTVLRIPQQMLPRQFHVAQLNSVACTHPFAIPSCCASLNFAVITWFGLNQIGIKLLPYYGHQYLHPWLLFTPSLLFVVSPSTLHSSSTLCQICFRAISNCCRLCSCHGWCQHLNCLEQDRWCQDRMHFYTLLVQSQLPPMSPLLQSITIIMTDIIIPMAGCIGSTVSPLLAIWSRWAPR